MEILLTNYRNPSISMEDSLMAVDKSLISGSTTMLILRLLEGKDMYGYEMIETFRKNPRMYFN